MAWKQDLIRAIREEVAAEKAATQAEEEKRRTWWNTTWALAAVPRGDWGEAQDEYVHRTSHSQSEANKRRRTGTLLPESSVAGTLPIPSFAREINDWLGRSPSEEQVEEAVRLLAQAEKDGMSLREFRQSLTGRPFTKAPENMTEADEDAVVAKVARTRPQAIANQVSQPKVAAKVASNKPALKSVRQAQSANTRQIVRQRKALAKQSPAAAAQTAAAVDAGQTAAAGFPSNSTEYTRVSKGKAEMIRGWFDGLRKQTFNEFDRHHMAGDLLVLERIMEQMRAFVEAEDDPFDAVKETQAEQSEKFQREMDEAESGSDLEAALAEIEQFANEGAA